MRACVSPDATNGDHVCTGGARVACFGGESVCVCDRGLVRVKDIYTWLLLWKRSKGTYELFQKRENVN